MCYKAKHLNVSLATNLLEAVNSEQIMFHGKHPNEFPIGPNLVKAARRSQLHMAPRQQTYNLEPHVGSISSLINSHRPPPQIDRTRIPVVGISSRTVSHLTT